MADTKTSTTVTKKTDSSSTATTTKTSIVWTLVCKNTSLSKKKNSTGDEVKQLQNFLKSKGWYNYTVDGVFGDKTEQGVKDFQTAYKLVVDGLFGPVSCAKVTEILKKDGTISSSDTTTDGTQTEIDKIIKRTYSTYDEGLESFLVLENMILNAPATEEITTGLTITETSSDDDSDSDSDDDSDSDSDDDS